MVMLGSECSPCCGPPVASCAPLINADRCLLITVTTPAPLNELSVGDSWVSDSGSRIRFLLDDLYHMYGNTVQVHFVQSQITIPLRISVLVANAPAIGVTETVVRRFNVETPFDPPAGYYDEQGPPWHLEVSISVTRVASNSQAGVTESITLDEYGQPRLAVDVQIGSQSITHDLAFTLYPTGRQRWRPGILPLGENTQAGPLQSFGIASGSLSSTAVSGRSSLADVNKRQGIQIDALAVALYFAGIIQREPGVIQLFSASIQQRIVLNEESALAFLAGAQAVQTQASGFGESYGISILARPAAAFCDGTRPNGLGSEESCALTALNFYGPPGLRLTPVPGEGGSTAGIVLFSGDALTCWSFLPLFDRQYSNSPPIVRSSVPCDDCTVSAEVTTGADLAYTVVHTSGLRAGTFDVFANRPFLAGESVTVTATCGGDQVQRTIKRRETPPDAPTSLVASRGPCNTIALSWTTGYNGGTPITGHDVEIRPIDVSGWTSLTGETANAAYVATGLLRIGYQFRVRARNQSVPTQTGGNVSAYSEILTVGFALAAPSNLVATRGPCDEVLLTWTPPQQEECVVVANYQVQYRLMTSPSANPPFVTFARQVSVEPTAIVTGLNAGAVYEFRVATLDERRQSLGLGPTDSQFSSIVRVGGAPPVPTNLVAISGDGQLTLTWEGGQDACVTTTSYSVRIFAVGITETVTQYTQQPVVLTGLANGTQYFIELSARNSFGVSPVASVAAVPGL